MRKKEYVNAEQPTPQPVVNVHTHEVRYASSGGANVTIRCYSAAGAEQERRRLEAAGLTGVEVVRV